ncbi:hypothetical protein ACH9EU_12800 [Kocuria sp. M1R5S2]|uniref:hypothetical protein n=1 Tax=Kocuria rhizosphaerae TaxID=3376285 RepID=UPI00379944B0
MFPVFPDGYVEVVGEYYHQAAIETLLRPTLNGEGVSAELTLALVPEPDNPNGEGAISVRSEGLVLGYLSRADARRYWPVVARIVASGYQVSVLGRVYAYKRRSYDGKVEISADVTLRLPEPEAIVPLNVELASGVLLPKGNSLQVLGEEDHFDHLFNYVPPTGEGFLLLELRRGTKQYKNGSTKDMVFVYLDGEEVGQLSGQSGGHYLPTIRHLEDFGKKTMVWGKIKGSALSASLTIHGAKSHELSDEWLDAQPTASFDLVPESSTYDLPDAYKGAKRTNRPCQARPAPRAGAGDGGSHAFTSSAGGLQGDASAGHAPTTSIPAGTTSAPKPPGRFSKILMWFALVIGVLGLFAEPVGATFWLLVSLITRLYRRRKAAKFEAHRRHDAFSEG